MGVEVRQSYLGKRQLGQGAKVTSQWGLNSEVGGGGEPYIQSNSSQISMASKSQTCGAHKPWRQSQAKLYLHGIEIELLTSPQAMASKTYTLIQAELNLHGVKIAVLKNPQLDGKIVPDGGHEA